MPFLPIWLECPLPLSLSFGSLAQLFLPTYAAALIFGLGTSESSKVGTAFLTILPFFDICPVAFLPFLSTAAILIQLFLPTCLATLIFDVPHSETDNLLTRRFTKNPTFSHWIHLPFCRFFATWQNIPAFSAYFGCGTHFACGDSPNRQNSKLCATQKHSYLCKFPLVTLRFSHNFLSPAPFGQLLLAVRRSRTLKIHSPDCKIN